jgi:2-polyprenyl-3-methyl-5-hydroxy-6-metoxy-1,4-benzoquinol methylase
MQASDTSRPQEEFLKYMPCPICDSGRSESIYPIDKAYASYHSKIDLSDIDLGVAHCKDCKHQFIQPVPQIPFLKAFYSSYMSKAKDGFYQERKQVEIPGSFCERYGHWLERISALCKGDGGALLDIGTGLGMFLQLAREYGFDVAGVEPNHEAARELRDVYGIPVYNCLLEELETTALYDAVTMWDLLEHLPDPYVAMRQVHHVLRPDGLVVLEIPVRDSFIHWLVKGAYHVSFGRIRRPLFLVQGIHHLQYFSEDSIQGFLAKNGFEVVEVHRAETHLQALYKRPGRGLFSWIKAGAYNTAIRLAFLCGRILKKQNKLIILARKRNGSACAECAF